jgi:hypothetical protein
MAEIAAASPQPPKRKFKEVEIWGTTSNCQRKGLWLLFSPRNSTVFIP